MKLTRLWRVGPKDIFEIASYVLDWNYHQSEEFFLESQGF
jgi:hypothetical protein